MLSVASKEHEVEPTPKMTLAERMGYGVRGKQIVGVSVVTRRCVKLVLVCMPMHNHGLWMGPDGWWPSQNGRRPHNSPRRKESAPQISAETGNTQGKFYELNSVILQPHVLEIVVA